MTQLIEACIGLGANVGHPIAAIQTAITDLQALPLTTMVSASHLYRTPAWGRLDQPDFINAAALLRTELGPKELLLHLLDIERKAGRSRSGEIASKHWGPRVLDLDLLLYGDARINEPGLRVPHPRLHERAFALVPLAEIAPNASFPNFGTVSDALRLVDARGVEVVQLK